MGYKVLALDLDGTLTNSEKVMFWESRPEDVKVV